MRDKKIKLSILILLVIGLTGIQAQTSINSSGGDASGSGGSVSYSVGQVVCQTHYGTAVSVSEGVQQPYEISVVTGIEEAKGISLQFIAYPNPTVDYLTLDLIDFEISKLHFQLVDMNGKLLQKENITDKLTRIDISHYLPAMYFLQVVQGNKEIKTFKIVKR